MTLPSAAIQHLAELYIIWDELQWTQHTLQEVNR